MFLVALLLLIRLCPSLTLPPTPLLHTHPSLLLLGMCQCSTATPVRLLSLPPCPLWQAVAVHLPPAAGPAPSCRKTLHPTQRTTNDPSSCTVYWCTTYFVADMTMC